MPHKQEFIKKVKDGAIRGWERYDILPSLTIAQACLESGFGTSELAKKGNNLFGIKGDYNGNSVTIKTKEYINGKWITVDAAFAKYPDQATSVEEHGAFFSSSAWRKENYKHVFGETDYKKAVRAILPPKAKAGYATDNAYDTKIINIIEQYNLTQYDKDINQEVKSLAVIAKPKMVDRRTKALGYPNRTKLAGNRRSVAAINRIGIHYTATTNGSISGHEIFWRDNRGWGLGGYTYYIARDGTIYWNYDHAVRTNGVAGHNTKTLNISVEASHKNNYTPAQLEARTRLILWLMQELNIPASGVLQHKEFSGQATSCAGYTKSEADALRAKLKTGKIGKVKTSAGATWVKDENAVILLTANIKVRDAADYKTAKHIRTAKKGERIAYTEVYEGNGHMWVKSGDEFIPYRPLDSKDIWVEFENLPDKEKRLQKYQGRGKGFRDLEMGQTITVRAGHQRWLHANRKHMEPAKRDYTGETDKISKIADVSIGYSDKAYYLERMKVWILEQDVVETRQSPGQPQIKEQPEGFMIEDVDLEEVKDKEAKPENLAKNEVILDGKVWVITEKE